MKIEQGILNPHTLTPVGQGITGAQYAIVSIAGLSQRCVVKKAGEREIAAECFCAVLGHHLSLPTLTPVVVTDPRDQSSWFGAREVNYPSLSTRLSIGAQPTPAQLLSLAHILSAWSQVGHVISFDELILNGDRNPQNVLWNGAAFTIIDHERALGVQPKLMNKLALFATQQLPPAQIASVQSVSVSAALAQQAMLGTSNGIWQELEAEFNKLPANLGQHYAGFHTLAKGLLPSLASNTANTMTPMFAIQP